MNRPIRSRAIPPELIDDLEKLAHDRLDDTCTAAGHALKGSPCPIVIVPPPES